MTYSGHGPGNFGLNAQEVATLKLLRQQCDTLTAQQIDHKLRTGAGQWAGLTLEQCIQTVRAYHGCDERGVLTDLGRSNGLTILNRQRQEIW